MGLNLGVLVEGEMFGEVGPIIEETRTVTVIAETNCTLKKIDDGTYGYCTETGEEIGLKRLIARPIATMTVEAQERHEKQEKVFADD